MKSKIGDFYNQLKLFDCLEPSKLINDFFDSLFYYAKTENLTFKGSKKISFIRKKAGMAESLLEKYYAQKYIKNKSEIMLSDFPYIENYHKLIELEISNIKLFLPKINKILFIGGGALPISAILLAQKYKYEFVIIDKDIKAVKLSRKIIKKLGLEKYIQVQRKDILEYHEVNSFDIVYSASLLFSDKNQKSLIKYINKNINAKLFLFRSAEGMRQLLYKKINTELLQFFFSIQIEIHPKNEIINSIILCTKNNYNGR